MSSPAYRRLIRDLKNFEEKTPDGISAAPTSDNLMEWTAVILGPEETLWEGGVFKLKLVFTEEYPNVAPEVKFVNKMFHPNIYNDGSIWIDILQHHWSPVYDVSAILTSLQVLLNDPNPHSPANNVAAKLYTENPKEYAVRVKEWVEDSWEGEGESDDEIILKTEEEKKEDY